MRVIPVIDLQGGLIVRGVAGNRAEYQPLQSRLVHNVSPESLAKVFTEQFDICEVYVADLDAIAGLEWNLPVYQTLLARGLSICLDAGVGSVLQAKRFTDELQYSATTVVGLESLKQESDLQRLGDYLSNQHAIFSLDLKAGQLLTTIAAWREKNPLEFAEEAIMAGFQRLILLDLADVGVASGTTTLPLLRKLRERHPELELIAGGGVRNSNDLHRLAEEGCSAALVASALHNGSLTARDLEPFQ